MDMTVVYTEAMTSVKTRCHHARSIGRVVRNVLAALFLSFLGSAAIVLAADYFLFRSGTWTGWTMVAFYPSHEDVLWWESQVGPLPPPTSTAGMVMPRQSRGRTGLTSGSDALTASRLAYGLMGVRMETASEWIRGSVLVSETKHAWHIGVELPGGMAFERIYIGAPGDALAHPTYGTWDFRILPIGLAINSLFVAGPLFVLVTILAWTTARTFRRIKGIDRRARGRCEVCAYVLIAGQNPCPECGHHRKSIEYKAASSGNKQS